eukprot:1159810_1
MSQSLRFRVRGPDGSQKVLDPLPSSTTMENLQTAIIKKLQLNDVKPSCIQIKFVFPPPQVISNIHRNATLSSLKLTSGNLIISVLDSPPFIPEPEPVQNNNKTVVKEEPVQNNN